MLSEPNISYKPFWGICRPLNSWRANSPNPIQIYCAFKFKDEYLEVDGKRCLYSDILKCSIQNEDANFKGKTKPFTHTILGQTPFMAGAIEPMMYVGIKLTLKDGTVLPIYVSKKKALLNSDMYLSDLKEAKSILF